MQQNLEFPAYKLQNEYFWNIGVLNDEMGKFPFVALSPDEIEIYPTIEAARHDKEYFKHMGYNLHVEKVNGLEAVEDVS
jgi:hypothetical protein